MTVRPDRDAWHLDGARWLAEMGDCTRRKVGAVIVGPDKRFWGMGYNGARPGGKSCLAGDCPRGRHYRDTEPYYRYCHDCGDGYLDPDTPDGYTLCSYCRYEYKCGGCGLNWPCTDAVAPGSSYDTGPGTCIASHAEANAVADAQRRGGGDLTDCRMYVSTEPCEGCIRHIRNTTGITMIRWPEGAVALP